MSLRFVFLFGCLGFWVFVCLFLLTSSLNHQIFIPSMLYSPCPMAGPNRVSQFWNALTMEQKLAVGVLCVAGVAALAFSAIRVRDALIGPFTTDVQTLVDLRNQLGPSDAELAEEQRRTDTDGDGVNDYDELNAYRTSPYLRDSDSDGEADNIEIAKGTDPNCAKGQTCLSVVSGTETASGTRPGFIPPPGTAALPGTMPPGGAVGASPIPPRDAATIRSILQSSGMSAAELAGFSDAELLNAYDQLLKESGATPEPSSSTSSTP